MKLNRKHLFVLGAVLVSMSGLAETTQHIMYSEDFEEAGVGSGALDLGWEAAFDDPSSVVDLIYPYSGDFPIAESSHTRTFSLLASEAVRVPLASNRWDYAQVELEMMVKFDPHSEQPDSLVQDLKFALYVDQSGNLVLFHGGADGDSSVHTILYPDFPADQWHRLRVMTDFSLKDQYGESQPFFQVYLNEVLLESASSGYPAPSSEEGEYGGGSWFVYAQKSNQSQEYAAMNKLRLNGSGGIDDLLMRGLDPQIIPGYVDWQKRNFSTDELEDEQVSGPVADPDTTGIANLHRYSFGIDRYDEVSGILPRLNGGANAMFFAMRQLVGDEIGVRYIIEWNDDIVDSSGWAEAERGVDIALESSRLVDDGSVKEMNYEILHNTPHLFYRVNIAPVWY